MLDNRSTVIKYKYGPCPKGAIGTLIASPTVSSHEKTVKGMNFKAYTCLLIDIIRSVVKSLGI